MSALVSALEPLTPVAYRAQQAAVRAVLLGAHLGLRSLLKRPSRRPSNADLAALKARLDRLLARDVENVRQGLYSSELLFSLPVREYVSGLPALALEVARMVRRSKLGRDRDLPAHVELSHYPEYFRRSFHWQTDGYLSHRSAELYDLGVEFLFLGTADVMRRQALAPFSRLVRRSPGRKRLLDVGCGTGRLLAQLTQAHPGHDYSGIDLSPYYIDRARLRLGDRVRLHVGNAEELPFAPDSFDAVASVFLFHELPLAARRKVLRELRRVLAPGGLAVIEDAAQFTDAPELRVFTENFGREMNEPYFLDYAKRGLEAELDAAGLEVQSVEPAFVAKVIVARATG